MVSKKKVGSLGAAGTLIIAIITITGTGTFDFSTTNIGQIGDNVVNNFAKETLGIDKELFEQRCSEGKYIGTEAQEYCDLLT